MHPYGVSDVEKLLRLPRSTIRSLVDAGFVTPGRGPRNTLRFSFQDLIVLRAARTLADANVPHKRITRSMKELRRHLPESMPLSGIAICAVGEKVVVKQGSSRWQAESGQYLLALENDENGSISVIERDDLEANSAEALFEDAVAIEEHDAEAAIEMYAQAVALDPTLVDAQINFGRLLHESGDVTRAELVYRDAIKACGDEPLLHYNLGVLLEERGRKSEALQCYESALQGDPKMADCLYNLALLCDELEKPKEAIRYMAQYRRLTRQ